MQKFAKLITTKKRQILITRLYNTDEEKNVVRIETPGIGCHLTATIGFDTEKDRDDFFEKFNQPGYALKICKSTFGDLME